MLDTLKELDQQIFFWVNNHRTYWMDYIAYYASNRFFWIPLYIFLIYLLVQVFQRQTWLVVLIIVLLIVCCDQVSASLIKPWVQRLRPCQDPALKNFVQVIGDYTGIYGFISSHAANSFGLAMLLWLILRKNYRFIYLLFFWALGVSYTRVYGGVHYPGDICIGALAGSLLAYIFYQVYNFLLQVLKWVS